MLKNQIAVVAKLNAVKKSKKIGINLNVAKNMNERKNIAKGVQSRNQMSQMF